MTKFFLALGITAFMCCIACNDNADSTTKTENKSDTTNKADKDKAADDVDAAQVPDAVKNAFAAKYAGAADVKWETATEDGKATYKVKWKEGDNKKKAEFGADGSFIKEDKD